MKVKEIMNSRVHATKCGESIADAAFTMKATGSDCLVVMDGVGVAGILTERDLVVGCLLESHTSWHCRVQQHMQMQKETVDPDMDAKAAAALMCNRKLACIPVIERGNFVGLLSFEKLNSALASTNIELETDHHHETIVWALPNLLLRSSFDPDQAVWSLRFGALFLAVTCIRRHLSC